jgi:hypothetical protein
MEKGRVEARLSGFLGGNLNTADLATVRVSFLNFKGRELGTLSLATVGPREREDETGLLPVASSSVVPAGTANIRVALTFGSDGAGGQRRVYADNLELILSEYSR